MNGRRARQIRQRIAQEEHSRTTWESTKAGPIRCSGMRRAYQLAKRQWKENGICRSKRSGGKNETDSVS